MLSVKNRLKRVFESARADVILVRNTDLTDPNFTYLTGFARGEFERAILVATPKRETLYVSPLEFEVAREQRPREMELQPMTKETIPHLKKLLRGKVVGYSGDFLPVNALGRFKELHSAKRFIDVSEAFAKARVTKDAVEIDRIRIANKIIKDVLKEIPNRFKVGMSEERLAEELDVLMLENGAGRKSFPSIVAFGENSAVPHHMPGDARLTPNTLVLIDCGCVYENYCSDVTRTFIFEPDERSEKYRRMKEMYDTVSKAQKIGLANIRPGVKGSVPHNEVAKFIDTALGGKYKGKFIHSLGHQIGIEVHDAGEGLWPGAKGELRPGMVVSDEPGIYIPGFGGVRIEDDVLVTKKGAEII